MIKPIRIVKDAIAVTSLAVISVAAFIKIDPEFGKKKAS